MSILSRFHLSLPRRVSCHRANQVTLSSSLILYKRFFSSDIDIDLTVQLPTNDNNPNLNKIRHSSAHVMAMAVQKLYPQSKVTLGPVIENGFYYDFDFCNSEKQLSDTDLSVIKK